MNSVKFSITFPKPLFKQLEQERNKEHINRSELLQKIVNGFYDKAKEKLKLDKYIEVHKKHAESIKESDARTMIGLESFNKEEW
jgi:metal-responsive CopG/Arc/MetJ family transcriptional regulator